MLIKEFIDYYIVNGDLCNEAVTDIGSYGAVRSEEQEQNLKTILKHLWRGLRKFNEEFYLNIERFEITHQTIPFTFTPTPETETGGLPSSSTPSPYNGSSQTEYTFSVIRTLLQVVDKHSNQLPIGQVQRKGVWIEEDANTASFVVNKPIEDSAVYSDRFPITAFYLRSPKMLELHDYDDGNRLELPQALYEPLASFISLRIATTMGTGDDASIRTFKALYDEDMRQARLKVKTPTLFKKPNFNILKGFA